jgi:hypothetical protein
MQVLRSARWLLLALLVSLVPASSYAGVFISVGFAPPALPVYEQPPCPEPGLMWTPGYWAYGDDGYYWVPGAWVPAPYEGALWTPPYWGWEGGLYVLHTGYWGPHVGYYGGVNYGFGYMGVGFVGGEWRGREFAYNTAVVHVNRTVIRNTYVNETVVHNTTIVNERRVAYTGGPGGIRHEPTPVEQQALHESHVAPTSYQQHHMETARTDRAAYYKANNGRPQNVVAPRPLPPEHHAAPVGTAANSGAPRNEYNRPGTQPNAPAGHPEAHPVPAHPPQSQPTPEYRPAPESHSAPVPQSHPAQPTRPEYQSHPEPPSHPASPSHQAPEYRPAPEAHPAPAPKYEQPQSHAAQPSRPEYQSHPEPQSHPTPAPKYEQAPSHTTQPSHPEPQSRPEPHAQPQSHPEHQSESKPKEPHR